MNDLSWFLYLAGTLPNMATGVAVISFVAMFCFALLFIGYLIDKADDGSVWEKLEPWRFAWIFAAILFLLSFLVPPKETFYAIAASEMGEEVLNSKIGGKAQQALEAWLDNQIAEPKKEEEK